MFSRIGYLLQEHSGLVGMSCTRAQHVGVSCTSFGFTNCSQLLLRIATIDGIPPHLQPLTLAPRSKNRWDIGRCRSTPKNTNPAIAHRALCNRSRYPTAQLDSIFCRAGIRLLKCLDVADHLDVSDPLTTAASFKEARKHFTWRGDTSVIDDETLATSPHQFLVPI